MPWLLLFSDWCQHLTTWSFPYSSLFLNGVRDNGEMSICSTGIFQIVAVNDVSQTSSFWQFVVHSPPVILKNLNKKIESKEDDTVTFDIKVQGDPKPEVKWWVEWESWCWLFKSEGMTYQSAVFLDCVFDCEVQFVLNFSVSYNFRFHVKFLKE